MRSKCGARLVIERNPHQTSEGQKSRAWRTRKVCLGSVRSGTWTMSPEVARKPGTESGGPVSAPKHRRKGYSSISNTVPRQTTTRNCSSPSASLVTAGPKEQRQKPLATTLKARFTLGALHFEPATDERRRKRPLRRASSSRASRETRDEGGRVPTGIRPSFCHWRNSLIKSVHTNGGLHETLKATGSKAKRLHWPTWILRSLFRTGKLHL